MKGAIEKNLEQEVEEKPWQKDLGLKRYDKIKRPLKTVHGPFIILANTYTPVPSSLPVTADLSAEKLKVLVRYYWGRCDTPPS